MMKWVACLVVDSNGDDLFTQVVPYGQFAAYLDVDPGGIVGGGADNVEKCGV